jgi:beta-lactamase regulating signal transducer with metallopeptidase domain
MNPIEPIFRAVFDASWRMACLIPVFLALRSLLRRYVPASVLFGIWIAVVIRLLIPFSVPAKWSPFNFTWFADPEPAALESQAPTTEAMEPVATTSQLALSPVQWASFVWSIGVIVLLIGRFRTHRRFVSRLQRSPTSTDPVMASFTAELGRRGIRVTVTDSVGAPALHGIFRPNLLFPPGLLEKLSPHEVQLVVAHELGHYKRRDLLAQALIHSARILHWFNPLIWVAARAARHDCELACDEYVVRHFSSTEPHVYGATLLKILGLAVRPLQTPLGLSIVESKQEMKRRIQMIVAHQPASLTRTALGCALLALVAGLSLTREIEAEPQPPVVVTKAAVVATEPAMTTAVSDRCWKTWVSECLAQ